MKNTLLRRDVRDSMSGVCSRTRVYLTERRISTKSSIFGKKSLFLILLPCLRTPVERTRHASTTRFASQDLQTRDIDVCALLDSLVNTAKKVHIECSLVLFRCFLGNFANPWILKYFAKLRVSHFTSTFLFLRNIVFTPLRLAVEQHALHLSARISYDTKPSEL